MQLLKIYNITKKDIPIYYRNDYSAVSDFSLIGNKIVTVALFFSIEMEPTGEKRINLQITDTVDYPIIPLFRALKEEIMNLEKKGELL